MEDADFQLQLEDTAISELLNQVISLFEIQAQQKQQTIKVVHNYKGSLNLDRARMKEVFENLLSNAIKYSHANTDITIMTKEMDNGVLVEFKDQGQGLSEADMKKLFTKFAKLSSVPTGKERSNGLGLSIVKTLVDLHKGKLWASSDGKGKGISFFVWLPF